MRQDSFVTPLPGHGTITEARVAMRVLSIAAGLFSLALHAQDAGAVSRFAPASSTVAPKNFEHYVRSTFGPGAGIGASASAAWGLWHHSPPEWGQGGDGFGRRLASSYGRRVIKNTVDFGVSQWRGETLSYVRCADCQGTGPRLLYALRSGFIRPKQDGGTTWAAGRLSGAFAGGFAPMLWYPDSRDGPGHALLRSATCIGLDVGKNLLKEFWPDLKRKLFRR
ncbi:MAG: hypothetical protein K6T59_15460 [Bryobacteraceae bacterium]|nr:hypothetical protein [Bryobacteraceae bacterium]